MYGSSKNQYCHLLNKFDWKNGQDTLSCLATKQPSDTRHNTVGWLEFNGTFNTM